MIAQEGEGETASETNDVNPNLRESQAAEFINRANQEPPPSNDIGGSPNSSNHRWVQILIHRSHRLKRKLITLVGRI